MISRRIFDHARLTCVLVALAAWPVESHAQAPPVALPLVWQDEPLAEVSVSEGTDGRSIDAATATAIVSPLLAPAALDLLKKELNGRDRWALGQTFGGVTLSYNPERVEVELNLALSARRTEHLGLRQRVWQPSTRIIGPQPFSAFVNLRAADTWLDGFKGSNGRQPLYLDFDGAANLHNWVVESQMLYNEKPAGTFDLRNARVVHDDPDNLLRHQAGDLSYPTATFQRYTPLVGVGFARNFSLQPYRISQPTGHSQFTLPTASTVDIHVNGVREKSLQLQPGTYELSDFPVVGGTNDVRLVITDASGRVEEKTFPIVSDGSLLEAGLSEYTANLGVADTLGDFSTPRSNAIVFSGLFRQGLTDRWTVGINAQGGPENQMLGLEQTWGSNIGLLRLEGGVSHNSSGTDSAWDCATRLEYRNLSRQPWQPGKQKDTWQASLQYLGQSFAPLGEVADKTYASQATLTYGHHFSQDFSATLGTDYRLARNGADDYRTAAAAYYHLRADLFLHANTTYSRQDNLGVFLGLTWTPGSGAEMVESSYDSTNNTLRADWSHRRTNARTGFDTNLNIEKHGSTAEAGGMANYTGERGVVRLQHDRRANLGQQGATGSEGTTTQINLASAVVYSGGTMAVTRPVANSFAIVVPADGSATPVSLNANDSPSGGLNDAESGIFGPAVLGDLAPYTYRMVHSDLHGAEYDQRDSFTLLPSYKSGIKVAAGNPSTMVVRGNLRNAQGKPLPLIGGEVVPAPGSPADIEPSGGGQSRPPILIFTNREGIFRLDGLAPGRYTLVFDGENQTGIAFDVPAGANGNLDLGTHTLDITPGRQTALGELP